MSCMNNIDPYNNAPPPRKGGGKCGAPPPQQPMQQQMPQRLDPQTENQMLRADLQVAINYIHHLGGTWPPPGQ